MSRAVEWCWILVALFLLNLTFASTQPVDAREGLGEGGGIYHAIARTTPRILPPQGESPFVYRFGTPLLVAAVAKSRDWVISAGFDRVNVFANAISVLLLAWLLQRHVAGAIARLIVLGAFMLAPHSPVRLAYFHPLSVDATTLALLLAGLATLEWYQSRPSPVRAAPLAILVAGGVIVHEVMLVIGMATLFAALTSTWRGSLRHTGARLPLAAGLIVFAILLAWITPTPSQFSLATDAARGKSPWQFAVAWFLVFGPLLALPLYFWRQSRQWLVDRPGYLVYLVILAAFAMFRAAETERYLVYASPVVWILIARSIEWARLDAASPAMPTVVGLQALSFRAFVPIGGPLDPPQIGGEVWERLGHAGAASVLSSANLWSEFCSPTMLMFYVLWYALTSVVVITLVRSTRSAK
jgi:hypothetical protein